MECNGTGIWPKHLCKSPTEHGTKGEKKCRQKHMVPMEREEQSQSGRSTDALQGTVYEVGERELASETRPQRRTEERSFRRTKLPGRRVDQQGGRANAGAGG